MGLEDGPDIMAALGVFNGCKQKVLRTFVDRFANEAHHAHGAAAINEAIAARKHDFGEAQSAVSQCLLLWRAAAAKDAQVLYLPLSFCGHVDRRTLSMGLSSLARERVARIALRVFCSMVLVKVYPFIRKLFML